jgi:hypothetical protein
MSSVTSCRRTTDSDQTVIFDSGYSGSGARSDSDTRVRGGPCEGEIPPDLDDDIVVSGTRVPDRFRRHVQGSHVLLAACAPHERAHETKSSGAFTGALLRALDGANTAELTYDGLMERMETLTRYVPFESLQGFCNTRLDKPHSGKATTGAGSSSTGRLPTRSLYWRRL